MDDPSWDYETPRKANSINGGRSVDVKVNTGDKAVEKRTENIARRLNGILCCLRDSNRRADDILEYLIGPCPDDARAEGPIREESMLDCIDISLSELENVANKIEANIRRFETI